MATIKTFTTNYSVADVKKTYTTISNRGLSITLTGLSSMTIPMYIAESAPANIRGRLVSINIVMVAAGQFIANCVAGLFSFTPDGWR